MRQILRLKQSLQDKVISEVTGVPLWTVKALTSWKIRHNAKVSDYVKLQVKFYLLDTELWHPTS